MVRMNPKSQGFRVLLLGVVLGLLSVGAAIFRQFVFGPSVLLYADMGSDSLNFSYPYFIHFSDYIRNEGFPSWSFSVGMGRDISYLIGFFLLHPAAWLPRDLIAHGLVYEQLVRSLIAGLSFFYFLRLRGAKSPASFLGALLLAFSACMCMAGAWHVLGDDVLCFSVLLLCVEIALQRGLWIFLTLAVALVGLSGAFSLYLAALFLVFYVPGRMMAEQRWKPAVLVRHCLALAGAAFLGVALAALIVGPNLYALLNSPRGSGTTSLVGPLSQFPVFGFESRLHYITAAMRLFSNDILGTANSFRGWQNYFEAPSSYCGLICLLLFPQAFIGASRRQKVLYGLFLGGVLLTTVFPWFRYLFWAFQGDYYRTLSLFSILGLVTLGMLGLSRFIEGRFNLWLLVATTIGSAGALYLPLEDLQKLVDPNLKLWAGILVLTYGLLLTLGHLMRRPRLLAWLLAAITAGELIWFDGLTVSERRTVIGKQELRERVGYNDRTVEAVADIKAADASGFYRITKTFPSSPAIHRGLNDALVFGYYSTSSYNNFPDNNYINFLRAVNMVQPDSEIATRWTDGLTNDFLLSLFAAEKYVVAHDPLPFQGGLQYEFVKNSGPFFVFRNAHCLPLGLAFDHFITDDAFLRIPPAEKAGVLLQAVVLSKSDRDKHGLVLADLAELERSARNLDLAAIIDERRKTALELTSFRQTRFAGRIAPANKSILVIQTPFDHGWSALQDGKAAPVLRVDAGLLGVALEAGEHTVEVSYRNPCLAVAGAISLAALLLLAVALWRWPRLEF